jgi:glycosyltransferase involved in cell wall biosynthesis
MFYPINDKKELDNIKKTIFGEKEYDFILMFNSRNIRRKQVPDTMAAFKVFLDKLPKEKADKCALILHTQPVDEHGTDLYAVRDMLFDDNQVNQIYFSDLRIPTQDLNLIYNISDAVILLTSNEGWGLSLTEGMMCGKMIIANVTGGMQDQMKFVDENGKWIDFDAEFCSNHFGKYKTCGEWAIPVFPSNMSIQGSPPTPYIFDDRCDFRDAANAIMEVYEMGYDERERRGKLAHEWVMSDESMMSSKNMSKNIIKHIDKVLATWKPKPKFELIKIESLKRKHIRHKLIY